MGSGFFKEEEMIDNEDMHVKGMGVNQPTKEQSTFQFLIVDPHTVV